MKNLSMTVATDAQIEAKRVELEAELRDAQPKFSYPHTHGLVKVKRVGRVGSERFICYTEDDDEENTFVEIELRTGNTLTFCKYNTQYFTKQAIAKVLGD